MGTIVQRKRNDGSTGYMAQVRVKRKGRVVHAETKTFDRKQAANAWVARRETELREPGALERLQQEDPPLSVVIDRYVAESKKEIGRTKAQVLNTIKGHDIAAMKCSEIGSDDIVAFARALPVAPQTTQNYLSHLAAVFAVAEPAWKYPLDRQAMRDAFVVAKRLGLTAKGKNRERRPTLDELYRLMDHFGTVQTRRPGSVPMQRIIPFAIFSTRRQEEITCIRWPDFEPAHGDQPARVMVRDMKHPGDKAGNDIRCELPPEAAAYIEATPKTNERIFPFTTDAISAAFTRACNVLGINTPEMDDDDRLHFHDLRHEGISRLFEMGKTIPQAASVSGHRSWTSLKRYSHLRQTGDKYAAWKWRQPPRSEQL
jgi:integrase